MAERSARRPPVVGQRVRVPNQAFVDEGKRAFDTYVALDSYMQRHDGRLPPNAARPPSLFEQQFGPGSKHFEKNGYAFDLDPQGRTRIVSRVIHFNAEQIRSRRNQATAGGTDRRATDEGGHYIARRYDGPTEAFNHFAQDKLFNRSAYRSLENRWAAATEKGEKVHVTITSSYAGGSKRPASLIVTWTVGGVTRQRPFINGRGN